MEIGQLAQRTGTTTSAIRYYERKGLLMATRREHGRRQYDEDVVRQLIVIRCARELGFSIAAIKTLTEDHGFRMSSSSPRWRTATESRITEIDTMLQNAMILRSRLVALAQCGCKTWSECGARLERRLVAHQHAPRNDSL